VGTVAAPRRALRFPTFAGTMGSYDRSAIHPRSPLVSLGGRYLLWGDGKLSWVPGESLWKHAPS